MAITLEAAGLDRPEPVHDRRGPGPGPCSDRGFIEWGRAHQPLDGWCGGRGAPRLGGGLYWNPASISGLSNSELEAGLELLIARSTLSSRVAAGALGPGLPAQTMYGHTGGNNGVTPLPMIGLVYRPENSFFTYGLGLFPVSGFSVNYPASRTNPILQPQAPFGLGLGPLYSSYQMLQLAPTLACQLTDEISVGVALNLDMGALSLDRGTFGTPTDVSTPLGQGLNYAPATDGRYRWGRASTWECSTTPAPTGSLGPP